MDTKRNLQMEEPKQDLTFRSVDDTSSVPLKWVGAEEKAVIDTLFFHDHRYVYEGLK